MTWAAPTSSPDLDHRGAAQRRVRRQVQLVVGALARRAGSPEAARVHVVGDQHGDRFAEPVEPRLAPGRLERHDQDRGAGRLRRRGRRHRQRDQDDAGGGEATRHAATARPARARRQVTETTQPRRAPEARHSLTRASAEHVEQLQHAGDRGGVEAAQRLDRGLAHLAEERPAKIDR